MAIRKKSREKLEKQKNDFLRWLQYDSVYSKEISELLCVWSDKIQDMDELEKYLKEKWCDESVISKLKDKYIEFLRPGYLYWEKEQYSERTQLEIQRNEDKMEEIKNQILDYRKKEWSILLNPDGFVMSKFKEYENYNTLWSRNLDEEIRNNDEEIQKTKEELKSKGNLEEKLESEIMESKNQIIHYKWKTFKFFYKKDILNIEKIITWKEKELENLNDEICELNNKINNLEEKKWKLKKIEDAIKNINNWLSRNLSESLISPFIKDSLSISMNWNELDKRFLEIKENIKIALPYLNKDFFNKLYSRISQQLKEQFRENDFYNNKIRVLNEFVRKYINLFFTWKEDGKLRIPTIFSKKYFDRDILEIIRELDSTWKIFWNIERDIMENQVDYWFMNDIFVHQSNFRVLDDIIQDWWLVSHNEIINKKNYNGDVANSSNDHYIRHKDVYFSRWFAANGYGKTSDLRESIFFVNTMSNFARKWYGVPISKKMQENSTDRKLQDKAWYSIISDDIYDEYRWGDNSYTKVKLEDMFIFVPESRKSDVERIFLWCWLYWKDENLKIVYIPESLYENVYLGNGNSYGIYEFMKKYIEEQSKDGSQIVPKTVVWNKEDQKYINSIDDSYKFAFCETVPSKVVELSKISDEILDDEILCNLIKWDVSWKKGNRENIKKLLDMVNKELNWLEELPLKLPIYLFKYWILSQSIDRDFLLRLWYSRKDIMTLYVLLTEKNYEWFCRDWSVNLDDMQELGNKFKQIRKRLL